MLTTRKPGMSVCVSKERQRLPFLAGNRRSIWVLPFCLTLSERLSGDIREKQECIWRFPQAHPTAPLHGDVPQCSAVLQPAHVKSESPDAPDSCGWVLPCLHKPKFTEICVDISVGCGCVGENWRTLMLPRCPQLPGSVSLKGSLVIRKTHLRKCASSHSALCWEHLSH